jgi:predicted DsbA family dithiol-disulfide isomerase
MATLSAFFQKNQDIGDIDVLLTIADDIGLERQALKRALETNEFTQTHQRALRRANLEDKILVVPTIIIGEARYDGVASKEWIEAALDNLLV